MAPVWSPDGQVIAYTKGGAWDIYGVRVDGSGQTFALYSDDSFSDPTWSPDGSQLAFRSWDGVADSIYIVSLANLDARQLLVADGAFPAWSPDGSKIAFYSERDGQPAGEGDIYVVNVDGSGLGRLTFAPGGSEEPDWSPDGRYIVYTGDRDGNRDLYVMNADGSNQRALTSDPATDYSPDWQ